MSAAMPYQAPWWLPGGNLQTIYAALRSQRYLAEAPSFGMPALVYDKQSRGAIAYLALAGELVRRQRAAAKTATA